MPGNGNLADRLRTQTNFHPKQIGGSDMSILETITRGKTPKPPIILLYGQEGVGKSTFAAKAPKTIFIPTEDGLNEIDCSKFPISKQYQDLKQKLYAIRDEAHDFETLAIDSISAAERMLFR